MKKEEVVEKEEIKNIKIKKKFTIFGFTVWRLLAYFIIYSIVGYLIETAFGLVKYGTLESRQSFLYGPFCVIYGIGAVVIILSLQYFKKNFNTLFLGGCLVGSILEYVISWIGEAILNVKWWDYSNMPFNINGRICLSYAVFWGILSLYLMISLNPKIDRLIDWMKKKINIKVLKGTVITLIIVMVIDCIITGYAVLCFMVRMIKINDIKVDNADKINIAYSTLYNNENINKIIHRFFNDEKMIKTFPRLKVEDINGNIIFFSDLLPGITPYYLKIGN